VGFYWRETDNPQLPGMTVRALFPKDSKYFGSSPGNFMINYRVDDLDALRLVKSGDEHARLC